MYSTFVASYYSKKINFLTGSEDEDLEDIQDESRDASIELLTEFSPGKKFTGYLSSLLKQSQLIQTHLSLSVN